MHGVYAPERGCLSVVQTARREDKQKWHGCTQNGLESIFNSHRGMVVLLPLYLVGVYQGTVTASLTGSLPLVIFDFSWFVLKTIALLPTNRYPRQPLFP